MSKVKMSEILETPMELNIYGDGAFAKANKQKKLCFSVALSKEEKALIQAKAKEKGYSVGGYVRFKAFNGDLEEKNGGGKTIQKTKMQVAREKERRAILSVALTEEERDFFKTRAEALGYSMSAYLRFKALED